MVFTHMPSACVACISLCVCVCLVKVFSGVVTERSATSSSDKEVAAAQVGVLLHCACGAAPSCVCLFEPWLCVEGREPWLCGGKEPRLCGGEGGPVCVWRGGGPGCVEGRGLWLCVWRGGGPVCLCGGEGAPGGGGGGGGVGVVGGGGAEKMVYCSVICRDS